MTLNTCDIYSATTRGAPVTFRRCYKSHIRPICKAGEDAGWYLNKECTACRQNH